MEMKGATMEQLKTVELEKRDVDSEQLAWLCVKPILEGVRGKAASVKAEAYNQLNEGQQALYIFFAFHNHTNTIAEFYWFSSYFISDLKGWPTLAKGLRFFEEEQLLSTCNDIEQLIAEYNKLADGTWRQALASDIEQNQDLLVKVTALYEKYNPLAKQSVQRMNYYIRKHSDQFFVIKE